MYVLILSTAFLETFLFLGRNERNMIKNVHWPSCKLHVVVFEIVINLEFFPRIFEKYLLMKFRENTPNGSGGFSMRTGGRTDRHYEAYSRFSQFYERAQNMYCSSCKVFVIRVRL